MNLLDEELMHHIANLEPDEAGAWLILAPHNEFKGAWCVDSLDPAFFFDFEDIIGEYRVLFPSGLEEFKRRADERGYRLAWTNDPSEALEAYEGLSAPPSFSINSHLPGTVQGFLPWQIEGYNKLIANSNLRGGLCLWDTGTGKTVFIVMGILHHQKYNNADTILVVVKSNNKRDMQKKLKKLGGIDSIILDGKIDKRAELYHELDGKSSRVIVTNYEKFREDQPFFEALITGRRVIIFWDEMPTKLKNRGTQLYNAVRDVLYEPPDNSFFYGTIYLNRQRAELMIQYELTATPIERDPGDQYSCTRLIDPLVLGTVTEFEKDFVLTRNPFSKKPKDWTRIDKMGHKLNFMMHRVDKTDPRVAPYFPTLIEEPVYIDWSAAHRKVYDALASKAALMLEEDEDISVLALIGVLQMLCDAPSMINESALRREAYENLLAQDLEVAPEGSEIAMRLAHQVGTLWDDGHAKIQRLKEDLTERYPDEKTIIFSTWASYIFPVLTRLFDEWGVTYAVYAGTDKQRQTAKDRWRTDPECRVLLSSDAGSDSVDLPEASLIINYNLPWLFSRLRQRINRASRADSGHSTLRVLTYTMAFSVEERRQELIEERRGYHDQLVDMTTKVSRSVGYSRDDLLYIITGRRLNDDSDSQVILDHGRELNLQE